MEFRDLPITAESERFDEHLKIENNSRIIFSGIFGIGKTYFLNNYFSSNSDNYIVIKINPINYSVSSNEDIFELIKFDIGFELFSKNPDFEKLSFNTKSAAEHYLIENYEDIIRELIENLPKLDHSLERIVKPIWKLYDKVKSYKKSLELDDRKELKEFLFTFTQKEGTYREENSITELLVKLIDSIKANNEGKEIVLLIDDLDRIDPEHIFRIMNVFSAHFDHFDQIGENKFGFDKVVLVCDINNIRGIFHSRYGSATDFSGYIDKFYSIDVFEYDFRKVIIENLDIFLENVNLSGSNLSNRTLSSNGYIGIELLFILSHLVKSHNLSMRTLLNSLKSTLNIKQYSIIRTTNIYSNSTPILVIISILEKMLGGKENFIKTLDKLITSVPVIDVHGFYSFYDSKIGNLAMLADLMNSNLLISDKLYNYKNKEFDIQIIYQIHHSSNYTGVNAKAFRIGHFSDIIDLESSDQNNQILKTKIPYFQLLKLAYQNVSYINNETS